MIFFNESKLNWEYCGVAIVSAEIKLSFNEIRRLDLEEFKCVGLLDVLQHHLGFMVFKFDTFKTLLKSTAMGSMFVECASPVYELFFKP